MTEDLKSGRLSHTFVGATRDVLVCSQFGNYMKFTVDVSNEETAVTAPAVNAFAVMTAARSETTSTWKQWPAFSSAC